ncbi:related to Transcriptional protein SWT1 [Zygosaccharomyces bailii]|nr:related to Transcriptional protein SWT1 [Zygosaccharomyces bailii]
MGLNSIHAPGGYKNTSSRHLTKENNKLAAPTAQNMKGSKYTVQDIEKLWEYESVQDKNEPLLLEENKHVENKHDEDLPMLDMDDESVERVSNYLSDRRISDSFKCQAAPFRTKEQVDSCFPMMVPTRLSTMFVVDTNFVISHLSTLEVLRRLASQFHHQIIIPSTVMQELDGLKMSSSKVLVRDEHGKKRQIASLARCANDWIYRNLANLDSGIMGQKLRQTLDTTRVKDDAILDCCLYFKEKLKCFVILMSNDKNLCLKALTEQVLTVSFRKGMSAQLIASKAYEENVAIFGVENAKQQTAYAGPHPATEFHELTSMIYNEVHETVVDAVDFEMREQYGEEICFVDYDRNELDTFTELCRCIVKFWVSVFCQTFKNFLKKADWQNLPSNLTEVPTTTSDVVAFVKFWGEVLNLLFRRRSNEENERLNSLNRRWTDLTMQRDINRNSGGSFQT